MTGRRKVHPTNQIVSKNGEAISFVASKERVIVPSDTNPISGEFNGCGLFVNITDDGLIDVGVNVNLSLADSPDVFIVRKLQHGYHPIAVYQIKETGTEIASVTFIGQI